MSCKPCNCVPAQLNSARAADSPSCGEMRRPEIPAFIDDLFCHLDTLHSRAESLRGKLDPVLRYVETSDKDVRCTAKRISTCTLSSQLSELADRVLAVSDILQSIYDRIEI